MDLYRIILVDDEEEVRKSIIRKIDWQAVGFTVVGDAENGEDALEKIEALEPDVVLTDIRMPYMDGLTLAEKIRQRYPSMKIVIFSGYDDFDYAKRAIKLNVTEYILKPVNVEELTAILRRIQESLDEEIEQKRDVSLLRENYRRSLPILREQFLKDLVSHQMDGKTVNDRLEQYDIPLAGAKKWISIAVKAEISEVSGELILPLHEERELIPISVMQILEENLKPYCRFSLFSFSGAADAEIAGIVAIDENNSQTSMIDILSDICKEIRKILMIPVTIGIGHSRTELGLICESFRSALDALGYCAIVGSGSTIYINDVEPVNTGKLQFTAEDESALIQAVKFGPEEKIRSVVSGIIGRMSDAKVHARQYQTYMFSTANCLVQLIQQRQLLHRGGEPGQQDLPELVAGQVDQLPGVHPLQGDHLEAQGQGVALEVDPDILREHGGAAHLRGQVRHAQSLVEQPGPPVVVVPPVEDPVDGLAPAGVKDRHQALPVQEHAPEGRAVLHLVEAGQVGAQKGSLVDVEQAGALFPVQDVHRLGKGVILPGVQHPHHFIPLPYQHGSHAHRSSLPLALRPYSTMTKALALTDSSAPATAVIS